MACLVQLSRWVWRERSYWVGLLVVLAVAGGIPMHAEAGLRKTRSSKVAQKPTMAPRPVESAKPKVGLFKRMVHKLMRSRASAKEELTKVPFDTIVSSPLTRLVDVGVVLQRGANLEPELKAAVQVLLGTKVQDSYQYRIAVHGEGPQVTIEERIDGQVHYNDRRFEVVGEGRLRRVHP